MRLDRASKDGASKGGACLPHTPCIPGNVSNAPARTRQRQPPKRTRKRCGQDARDAANVDNLARTLANHVRCGRLHPRAHNKARAARAAWHVASGGGARGGGGAGGDAVSRTTLTWQTASAPNTLVSNCFLTAAMSDSMMGPKRPYPALLTTMSVSAAAAATVVRPGVRDARAPAGSVRRDRYRGGRPSGRWRPRRRALRRDQ